MKAKHYIAGCLAASMMPAASGRAQQGIEATSVAARDEADCAGGRLGEEPVVEP